MPLRISSTSTREIRATLLAIKSVDRDLRREVRAATRDVASQEWARALERRASTTLEKRVLADTARVSVSDQNVRVRTAGARRKVTSGGLRPVEYGRAVEFGADQQKLTAYRRDGHPVRRHTARQMRPRNRSGYVFFPAAAEMIPRLLAAWVQTTVRTIAEALEAGGRK